MRHFMPVAIPDHLRGRLSDIDVMALSIEVIGSALIAGTHTAAEFAAACLAQVNLQEPYLNAFIWINRNALSDAERADDEIAHGTHRGPLHGVPVVIKDNMDLVGTRTTAGYSGFAANSRVVDPQRGTFNGVDLVPNRDARLVEKLKEAGAIIIGKSNLPDFGLDGLRAQSSYNGDTLNTYNAAFAPGASSTGSASAVAAGMGVVAIGTDTAGSILFPASAQSLVGLKPSFGLVPKEGIFPGLFNHDVAGPITRSVADAAAVLDAIADRPPGTPTYAEGLQRGTLHGKRIGLFEPGIWAPALHPAVQEHYSAMVEIVTSQLGAQRVDTVFGDTDWQAQWSRRKSFAQCNAYLEGVDSYLAGLGGHNPTSREAFEARSGFPLGVGTTAPLHALLSDPAINFGRDSAQVREVTDTQASLAMLYEQILEDKQIDALFLPRSTQPLPDLDGNTGGYLGDQVAGTEVNELGLPVVTVPAGYLADGRPIAIDIVGARRLGESEILAMAYDFEQHTRLRNPPPANF
ncbi:amidase [Burkholderia gladioli]|uniref:amidase n=1 Tax=Burkholderia gladioli TaxID=28095 RepID=UPI001C24BBA1|nr:amidase [Burkholderia gladioli]MBU9681923.1 amidase [Burkholderia gladioli]